MSMFNDDTIKLWNLMADKSRLRSELEQIEKEMKETSGIKEKADLNKKRYMLSSRLFLLRIEAMSTK